jgi:4-hydroxybenzoate polyprenyltransferase
MNATGAGKGPSCPPPSTIGGKLCEYGRLCRIQSAAAFPLPAVFGALAMWPIAPLTPLLFVELFIIGILLYIQCMTLNEYSDVEVDRKADALSTKPLVKGTIPRENSLYLSIISALAAFVLGFVFFNPLAALMLILLTLEGALYNIYSKKHFWTDVFVGTWAFLFTIFGAMTISLDIQPLVYVIAVLWFIRLLFANSVTGGIKDIESDIKARARTVPVYFGVGFKNGRMLRTPGFVTYEYGLEACFVLIAILPWYMGWLAPDILVLALVVFFMAGFIGTLLGVNSPDYCMKRVLVLSLVHEISGFMVMGIALVQVAGILYPVLALVLALVWYAVFVRAVYGGALPTI